MVLRSTSKMALKVFTSALETDGKDLRVFALPFPLQKKALPSLLFREHHE